MNDTLSLMSSVFEPLLRMTVQASVVVLVVLAIRAVFGQRLSARWLHALWIVVLIRLALPWTPQASWSPFALMPSLELRSEVATAEPVMDMTPLSMRQPYEPDVRTGSSTLEGLAPSHTGPSVSAWHVLYGVWLAGIVVLTAYVCITTWLFLRSITRCRLLTDQRVLELLEDCKQAMGVRAPVGVLVTDKATSPALLGFVRPRLLLPPGVVETLSPDELRHVFLHELAHLRRHDVLLGWVACLIQIVHWCNPLVWLAANRMRADRELACDALAMQALQDDPRRYGETILRLLERFSRPRSLPALTGILEDKTQLRRRLTMISRFNARSERRSLLGVAVLLAIGAIALTDAPAQQVDNKTEVKKGTPSTAPADSREERISDGQLPEGSRIDEHGNIVDRIDWPFVNDPAVLGKWESVDFVHRIDNFNPEKRSTRKLFLKGVVFEEGGKANYGFSKWTKGKFIHAPNNTAADYIIKNIDGQQYLFMEWKSGDYTIRHMKPRFYVFKKLPADSPKLSNPRELMDMDMEQPEATLRSNSHIDEKGNIVDKIDYPFVNDPDVIGTWKSVDFVDNKDQFDPAKRHWKGDLFLKQLVFEPGGKMGSTWKGGSWTKGLVLSPGTHTAPAYEIVKKDGAKYMLFQWKSGDYTVLHREPCYYVLKKVEGGE